MPKSTTPPRPDAPDDPLGSFRAELAAVLERVDAVELLARDAMGDAGRIDAVEVFDEVRCRRLVILGPGGDQRIVAECTDTSSSIDVHAPGDADTKVSVVAINGESRDDEDRPVIEAIVSVHDRGEMTGSLDGGGLHFEGGSLWLDRFSGGRVELRAPEDPPWLDLNAVVASGPFVTVAQGDRMLGVIERIQAVLLPDEETVGSDVASDIPPHFDGLLGGCGGRCDFLSFPHLADDVRRREWHDKAIRHLDRMDLDSMLWIVEQVELHADGEADEAQAGYCFSEFTSEHNWADPVGVKRLAHFLESWAYGHRSDEALRIVCKQTGLDYSDTRHRMVANERTRQGRSGE